MLPSVNGVVSEGLAVYLPGCMRKMNVIQIMLVMVALLADSVRAVVLRT